VIENGGTSINRGIITVTSIGRCELISWNYFYELARKLALSIHEVAFYPDIIIAISRGGCIPARIICDYLDVFDLDVIKIEHYHGTHQQKQARLRYPLSADITGKRVLLLDDVSDTGDSFEIGIDHLLENGEPAELKTAVLHHKIVSSYIPDFYAEVVQQWRWIIYPWAVMEDLRSLLVQMDEQSPTIEGFADYILQNHQLEVPLKILKDAFLLYETP
jgi:hypoxanthine phosphoribosyltransferase